MAWRRPRRPTSTRALDELTLPEAAFLAALPKAPNNYNPFRFPEAARTRRDFVLDRMLEDHAITRGAGGGGENRPGRDGAVPPARDGARRRVVRRGSAPANGRPVRRRTRPPRADWWCAPAWTLALQAADGPRAARRADELRPPAGRLARPGRAGWTRGESADGLAVHSLPTMPASAGHAAGLEAGGRAGDGRRMRRSWAGSTCRG